MKIKRIIAVMLAFFTVFTAETLSASYAFSDINLDDIVVDVDASLEKQYEFTLKSDGTYEISGYIRELEENPVFAPSPDIYLPKSYKGKPVTSIGDKAFCTNNFDYITGTVDIPSSITSIGDDAFWLCNFQGCNIPESVTHIGKHAFGNTPWLENMQKQNPIVIVNNILIDARTAKGDVTLPDGLTSVPAYSFYENADVISVKIPDSVKTIGDYAFKQCTSLSKINIPDGITEIGKGAFQHCEKLSGNIKIPSSVKIISDFAFMGCKEITSVNIENGVTEIGTYAFGICMSMTDINIPDSVKTIGNMAFIETHKLKNIVIPASVESIGKYCFQYAYTLDSVTIENANCEIYDDSDTFPSSTTLYGSAISTAHSYADKYSRKFIATDQTVSLGDVNNDKAVDAVDSTMILMAYSLISTGNTPNLNELQLKAGDVDLNGTVDSVDSSLILSYYSYLSTGGKNSFEDFLKNI